MAFIDDATRRICNYAFTSEIGFDYFRSTRNFLETHGKPVALYSDKHSIFRVNKKDADRGDRITQFSRALGELNIDIICANIPQANGRVERAFGTLQDQLAKGGTGRHRALWQRMSGCHLIPFRITLWKSYMDSRSCAGR